MIFILILQYAALFFFVPLVFGIALIWSGWSLKSSGVMFLGTFFLLLGCWGAVSGIPNWHALIQEKRAANQYFESRCKAVAIVQLPSTRLRAEGLVWLDPDKAQATSLTSADRPQDFVNPGRGWYSVIQYQKSDASTVEEVSWSDTSRPDNLKINQRKREQASLPYVLQTRSITTDEDRRWGVEGVETTISDAVTHAVLARRVVIAATPQYTFDRLPAPSCPTGVLTDARCDTNGCSVIPFVVSAVAPVLPREHEKIFHLYKAMGPKDGSCHFEIDVGPGLSANDLEWWGAERDNREDFHLRIKGTNDELVCPQFLSAGSSFLPMIRFADGGAFPFFTLFDSFQKQPGQHRTPQAVVKKSQGLKPPA
ncbi:hypothetical protein SAMN05216350_10810 [Polaromonas sp. YR568]|nr:hypothetical protein SAMN05216350_10810 [Polaromonas sp. YR568]